MRSIHYLWGLFAGWGSFRIILMIEYFRHHDPEEPPYMGLKRVICAVGGVISVFLVDRFFPNEASLITVSLGAFILALISSDLLNLILPKRNVS